MNPRLCSIILLLCAYSGRTQDRISSDLSDQTESADFVGAGRVQPEASSHYNVYRSGGYSLLGLGLIRCGLYSGGELRLLVEEGFERDRYMNETVQSNFPLSLSGKFRIIKETSGRPSVAVSAYLSLPLTGHNRMQTYYWSQMYLLVLQHNIGQKFKATYNAGMQEDAFSPNWSICLNAQTALDFSDKLGVFTEYFSQLAINGHPMHNAGAGILWKPVKNLELNASTGTSLNPENENYFIRAGTAWIFR